MKSIIQKFIFISLAVTFCQLSYAVEPAGKVIFSSGINKVIDNRGKSRIVKRGSIVNTGDRLKTSSGRMQVRFSDNGFVSVKPRSELLIQEYKFNGKEDGKENAIFNLLKGSVRAISGFIGKTNKKAYQYRTPVATIGIRGTAFVLNYCNGDCFDEQGKPIADGLYVNNGEGKVILTSKGGSIDLTRGQFAYVRDSNSAPSQLRQPPAILEQIQTRVERYSFRDVLDAADNIVLLDNTRQRSGFTISTSILSDLDFKIDSDIFGTEYNRLARPNHTDGDGSVISNVDGNTVVFLEENAAGLNRMIGYGQNYRFDEDGIRKELVNTFVTTDTAEGTFGGNNEYNVIWGTWESGWENRFIVRDAAGNIIPDQTSVSNAANDYLFHYILSNQLTPLNAVTGRYEGLSTRLTYGSKTDFTLGGQVAYFNSNMTSGRDAIYGQQRVYADINFNDGTINEFEISGRFSSDRTYSASLRSVAGTQSIYNQSTIELDATCAQDLCGTMDAGATNNETGVATIEFVGQNAAAAIGSYGLQFIDTSSTTHIIGGTYLVEQNQSSEQPSGPTGIQGMAIATSGISGSSVVARSLSANTEDGSLIAVNLDAGNANITGFNVDDSIRDTGALPTSRTQFNALGLNAAITTPPATAAVALGAPVQGNDANLRVSWGYWINDYQLQNEAGTEEYDTDTNPLHFIYSDNITPDATVQSIATTVVYDSFIGGNVTYQNAVDTGTLSGSMTVDFAAGNIDAFDLTANFAGGATDTIELQGQGAGFGARSFAIQTGTGVCNVCGTTSPLNGATNYEFIGPNAEGVAGTFHLSDGFAESITGSFVLGQ